MIFSLDALMCKISRTRFAEPTALTPVVLLLELRRDRQVSEVVGLGEVLLIAHSLQRVWMAVRASVTAWS